MADGSNGTGVFGRNDGQEHDALSAASGSAAAAAVARSVAAYRRKSAEAGESLTRDGRAGEFSGSVIGRVRLESGGFQPERVGLEKIAEALSAASGSAASAAATTAAGSTEAAAGTAAAAEAAAGTTAEAAAGTAAAEAAAGTAAEAAAAVTAAEATEAAEVRGTGTGAMGMVVVMIRGARSGAAHAAEP